MDLRSEFSSSVPAIVLAEGEFGQPGGKTANGVVMHSELFDVQAVVDSERAGSMAGDILEYAEVSEIPIVEDVPTALEIAPGADALVIGVAPAGGGLPAEWVPDIQDAIKSGCDVVSGLHVFLGELAEWRDLAAGNDVRLFDVRKPPDEDDLRVAEGRTDGIDADVVLTVGTDCAVGKRTTTFELYRAARESGLDAGWVATGQTGIMVGAHRGVVIDRVPADFTAGVVEDLVQDVAADHDIVFVEGQGALTHRAYSGVTLSILHGAWPDAVVLVDDPDRQHRYHFEQWPVRAVGTEQTLIESLSDATVAGLSTWGDPASQHDTIDLPVANVYEEGGADGLLSAVREVL